MHNRITNFIKDSSIKLCLFTSDIKLHFLIELLIKISDHTRELTDYTFNRHHSYLHNWFVKVSCYSFKVFNLFCKLLIISCCCFVWRNTCWYKTILSNNKLADKVHKDIKLIYINSYCMTYSLVISLLSWRCSRCLLSFFLLGWLCNSWLFLNFFLLLFFCWCIINFLKWNCYCLSFCCLNLWYTLNNRYYFIKAFVRYNNYCEIFLKLLIFYILCWWLWFDNIAMSFKILKYKKCPCCLKYTILINCYYYLIYSKTLL